MLQLIFGAALGFMLGQGTLRCAKRLIGWLRRDEVRGSLRRLSPLRGSTLLAGFIRYAGVLGVAGALITFGVWTVRDYLAAAGSKRSAASASVFRPAAGGPASDSHDTLQEAAELTPASNVIPSAVPGNPDPYDDSDFKVHRRPHRAGTPLSLKETLVQRSEDRARADLLKQTQEHMRRSQYDCEAAERASKYLKAGLDVWGFATWQIKYFPMDGYQGATLPQCKDIKDVLDSSRLDLQSAVADGKAHVIPGLPTHGALNTSARAIAGRASR